MVLRCKVTKAEREDKQCSVILNTSLVLRRWFSKLNEDTLFPEAARKKIRK